MKAKDVPVCKCSEPQPNGNFCDNCGLLCSEADNEGKTILSAIRFASDMVLMDSWGSDFMHDCRQSKSIPFDYEVWLDMMTKEILKAYQQFNNQSINDETRAN